MTSQTQLVALAVSVAMSFVVAAMADRKGYNKQTWGFFGLVLWPVALLMIAVKRPNRAQFRRCPDCGSTDVPTDVPVCRHCGRDERKQASVGPAT